MEKETWCDRGDTARPAKSVLSFPSSTRRATRHKHLSPFLLLTLLTKPFKMYLVITELFFLKRKIRPLLISQGRERTGCTHLQLFLQKTCAKTLSSCSSGAPLHLLTRHFRSGFTQSYRKTDKGEEMRGLINVKMHHTEILFNHLLFLMKRADHVCFHLSMPS